MQDQDIAQKIHEASVAIKNKTKPTRSRLESFSDHVEYNVIVEDAAMAYVEGKINKAEAISEVRAYFA